MQLRASVGGELSTAGGDMTPQSQSNEMTSVSDPFFSQTTTADHHRQESGDSGLGNLYTISSSLETSYFTS